MPSTSVVSTESSTMDLGTSYYVLFDDGKVL